MMSKSKPIDLSWEKLSGKHVSLGTLALGFIAYGAMIVWLNDNFFSEAQGAELVTKVDQNHALIVDFKDEYRIKNAMADVRSLKYMRDDLKEKEQRDGKSDLLTQRRRDNQADLDAATEYKDCLLLPVDVRPKCSFLVK